MRRIRTYHDVDDDAGREVLDQVVDQRRRLAERLGPVDRVVAVASGKGGVGKSVLTAEIATALADAGHRVGAVDADLNGPSLARMLGAVGSPLRVTDDGVEPAAGAAGVRVISMDLLLAADDAPLEWKGPDEARFAWRGAVETGALREFLSDVAWGPLEYLLVDVPPGTDRLARLLELVPGIDGVLLVTTPSEASRFIVAKSARLVRDAAVPAAALATNMTAFRCPDCGSRHALFDPGDEAAGDDAGLPLWGEIPFEPRLSASVDRGHPYVLEAGDAPAARALRALARRVADELPPDDADADEEAEP